MGEKPGQSLFEIAELIWLYSIAKARVPLFGWEHGNTAHFGLPKMCVARFAKLGQAGERNNWQIR